MDPSTLRRLQQVARTVVRDADHNGEIDAGLFTIGVARQRIAVQMGLSPSDSDQKSWKSKVKELVMAEMNNLDDKPPAPSPSRSKKIPTILSNVESSRRTENRTTEKAKRPKKAKKVMSDPDDEDDATEVEDVTPSAKNRKGKKARREVADSDEDEHPASDEHESVGELAKSESEMSSLIDDHPPKKKRKSPSVREAVDIAPERKKRKHSETIESADEEQKPKKTKSKKPAASTTNSVIAEDPKVKELKAIVVACGVRKLWKKEFEGKDTPQQQISHLRQILNSLGMKGQPTKAKASTIKEQRELAAELGDIKEFEKSRGLGSVSDGKEEQKGRPKRSAAPKRPLVFSDSEEEKSEKESEQESDEEAEDSDPRAGTGKKAQRRQAKRVANSSDEDEGVSEGSEVASDDEGTAPSDDDD